MRKFAWSFSALEQFENCPKQYFHLKIEKDVQEEESLAQMDGKAIHEALHAYVIHDKPLPLNLRYLQKIADPFKNMDGEKHGEMKIALNRELEPVGWMHKDVWVRTVIDLIIIQGDRAIIVDWKTGRKKDKWDQLRLSAACVAALEPTIKEFVSIFVWTEHDDLTPKTISVTEVPEIWNDFLPRVSTMEKARKTTNFPAKPGGLCKGWCPVVACPHFQER